MNAIRTLAALGLAAALSAALSACGGGGAPADETLRTTQEVPASASVSPMSYSQFAGSLTKTETGQPLDASKVVPPTSETELPVPVS